MCFGHGVGILSPSTRTLLNRSAFTITDTDDNAIAAAAMTGERRSPVIG
jgi:hypothetical protein